MKSKTSTRPGPRGGSTEAIYQQSRCTEKNLIVLAFFTSAEVIFLRVTHLLETRGAPVRVIDCRLSKRWRRSTASCWHSKLISSFWPLNRVHRRVRVLHRRQTCWRSRVLCKCQASPSENRVSQGLTTVPQA